MLIKNRNKMITLHKGYTIVNGCDFIQGYKNVG